jgi:hypothetical protein
MLLKILFWTALLGYLGWRFYRFIRKLSERMNFLQKFLNQKNNNFPKSNNNMTTKKFGDISVTWKKSPPNPKGGANKNGMN